jgi:hypothetical protein
MKKRSLYAEIVEGFDALSNARDGKTNLRVISIPVVESGNTRPKADEPEPRSGILDLPVGEVF